MIDLFGFSPEALPDAGFDARGHSGSVGYLDLPGAGMAWMRGPSQERYEPFASIGADDGVEGAAIDVYETLPTGALPGAGALESALAREISDRLSVPAPDAAAPDAERPATWAELLRDGEADQYLATFRDDLTSWRKSGGLADEAQSVAVLDWNMDAAEAFEAPVPVMPVGVKKVRARL